MSNWPPPPTMLLSTRSARFLPVRACAEASVQAGLPGIDLDLSARAVPALNRPGTPTAGALAGGRVDAIWLPSHQSSRLTDRYLDRLLDRWVDDANGLGARSVVVDRDVALRPIGRTDKRATLIRLRERVGPGVRIVVVLRPHALEGTRHHLNSLVTLRRTAEEWDFDLGIDLLGPVDQRWEAEAAIQRLQSRLTLVRIPSIADARLTTPRNRITSRVVAYLLDQGYQGSLSLNARLRPTDLLRPAAFGVRAIEESRAVIARHQRLYGAARPVVPFVARTGSRAHDRG